MQSADRKRVPVSLLALALLAPTLFGACNGSGGGGSSGGGNGGGLGNAAIEATLDPLFASLRLGDTVLPAQLTSTQIPNPFAATASATILNIALGANSEDGTATVDAKIEVSDEKSDGSRTVKLTVTESGGTHVFLQTEYRLGPLELQARTVPYSYAGISPTTGEGEAFIVVRAEQTVNYQRTFSNQSPSGATLIDASISPQPAAWASGTYSFEIDFLLDYVISRDSQGALVATLGSMDYLNYDILNRQDGGLSASPLELTFTKVRVNNTDLDAGARDIAFPVGPDPVAAGYFNNNDPVEIAGALQGGVSGTTQQSVSMPIGSALRLSSSSFTATTMSVNGTLDILTPTEIGDSEIDLTLIAFSYSSGVSAQGVRHTLSRDIPETITALSPIGLSRLLFPDSRAEGLRSILVVH